jgi:DNA-binding response OmpR family regulator
MRILIVEDETRLSEAIEHLLKKSGYTVDAVYDGLDGYHYILSDIYDIVILDVMLPNLDGFTIIKKIREEGIETPVIMLTAKSEIDDRVTGLNYGADDYLTKPFSMDELIARINALGRRKAKQYEKEIQTYHDIEFDKDTLILSGNGKTVQLTHLESALLEYLLSRKEMITSKEAIIVKLWGYDSEAEDNNVEVYVSFLRKKLNFVSKEVIIKTTRNVGYSLQVKTDV